jgi:hypothetical protein
LPEDVFGSNAWWKTARAGDLDPPGVLADEYRSTMAIVTVTDRVQDGFSNHALVEGGNVPDEEPLLEVLQVVAQVDEAPDLIEYKQESLPELVPVRSRSGRFVRAVLKHNLRLGKMSSQGFTLP